MAYSVNFQALALWLAAAAVVGGGYFIVSPDSSQQTSFNIGMEEDTVPGELTRLSVEQGGEPIQGANISIDGEYIGTTNSQGIKGFETPENNFTVEASKGDISSETTFTVEDGSFSSPDDSEGSESDDDSNNSDGSDNDGEDDDSDDSNDSDNEDSNQDSSEDDQQDSSEDTSETVDDFTGLEIDEDPMIGELRTITVYDKGEEVSNAEVTVNGEVVGTTNAGGTVTFGVPNTAEITVSTDTGLSETFTVEDYTEDEQNQTDDQNNTEEDLTTGIQLDADPVSGTTNRIILYDQGDRVSGETVYLEGSELGQTGSNGAIEFEVPLKEQITVTTDYGLESRTFNVTEDHPEPEIVLNDPFDTESFDTPTGTNTDVTFEADVDITEDSGTASLMIDGSEAYTQELSSGTNSISTTQALSGGTHNWQVEVDTPEYNVSSSSRSLTVNEVDVENGLSLQNNATAGEYNYVRLYDSGEPVEGMEVTVNGDSIGTTDSNGEVGFEVPNAQEITVSASGYSDITRTVEGYEESFNLKFNQELVAGERNTLQLVKESGSLLDSEAEIFVEGDSIGETSGATKEFYVPLRDTVSVTANPADRSSKTVNKEIQRKSIEMFVESPNIGQQVQGSMADFVFKKKSDSSLYYEGILDGKLLFNGTLSENTETSLTRPVRDSGSHEIQINLKESMQGQTVESRTTQFETTGTIEPVQISMEPKGEVNDYNADLNFTIDSPLDYRYKMFFEGQKEAESSMSAGQTTVDEIEKTGLESGEHQWTVEVTDDAGDTFTNTETFETLQNPPIADIALTYPEDGAELTSTNNEISAQLEADAYKSNLDYNLMVNGTQRSSGSLDEGMNYENVVFSSEVGEAYEIKFKVSDGSSTIETKQITVKVTDNENAGSPS